MKQSLVILILFCINVCAAFAEEAPFIYDDHGQRDPLWSLVDAQGNIINYNKNELSLNDLILEGIMVEQSGNIAIINGNIVNIGDRIGDFIVQEIDSFSVTLEKGQDRFVLNLKKEE